MAKLTSRAALQGTSVSWDRAKKIKPSSFKGVVAVTFNRPGSKRTLARQALKSMAKGRSPGLKAKYGAGLSNRNKRKQLVLKLTKWAAA